MNRRYLFKLLVSLFLGLALFVNCKKENTDTGKANTEPARKEVSALVVFSVGDIKSGDTQVKPGFILKKGETIKTSKKSVCDIQIKGVSSEVVIRIKEDSSLTLDDKWTGDTVTVKPSINMGTALFKVEKLNKDSAVEISTPTITAGVRGTSFEVTVTDKDVKTTVYEGSVAVKTRVPELEALPDSIVDKSTTLASFKREINEKEVIVDSGKTMSVSTTEAEKFLKDSGLKEAIEKASAANDSNIENIAKLAAEIDSIHSTLAKAESGKSPVNSKKVIEIKKKELTDKLREFDELIAIEKSKLENEANHELSIQERTNLNREKLLNRIEIEVGKKREKLVLKDGSSVEGVIYQDKTTNDYIILSPEGKKHVKVSDAEGIGF